MMHIITVTVFIAAILSLFWSLLMIIRNVAVFKVRTTILKLPGGMTLHDNLPSYIAMVENPKYFLLWTTSHWLAWIDRQQKEQS